MRERVDFEPVRGMRDRLPVEQARLAETVRRLETVLDSWGYDPIDLPLLERRELYLKKAGEELVGKLYDFVYGGRSLALRPEWTASVLRAYLRSMQSEPLPLRLRYSGPVFRYERPQRVTYRQFTQVGVELIGASAPRGDAEVIALACQGLVAAGVANWTLTIGHVGVARRLLAGLPLPERTASRLLWSMERLRRGDGDAVRRQLLDAVASEQPAFDLDALAELPDDTLAEVLGVTLRAMGLSLEGASRSPDAIVQRLIRKLRRGDPRPAVEQALDGLRRLSQAYGAPAHALAVAAELLRELALPVDDLQELRVLIELLERQGVEPPRLRVDLGLGRGLHYYTGMIFEIEDTEGLQLCGGGRYDDLVGSLQRLPGEGGAAHDEPQRRGDVPAVGFAYGLERVAEAAAEVGAAVAPSVLIAAGDDAFAMAMGIAETLRSQGYRALLDSRGRSLQSNLRDAQRRRCRALVDLGGGDDAVDWYDLDGDSAKPTARRVTLHSLIAEAQR